MRVVRELYELGVKIIGSITTIVIVKSSIDVMCSNSLLRLSDLKGALPDDVHYARRTAKIWIDTPLIVKLVSIPPFIVAMKY
jgi:hypothetical protein